jgi:hypothetical protein
MRSMVVLERLAIVASDRRPLLNDDDSGSWRLTITDGGA